VFPALWLHYWSRADFRCAMNQYLVEVEKFNRDHIAWNPSSGAKKADFEKALSGAKHRHQEWAESVAEDKGRYEKAFLEWNALRESFERAASADAPRLLALKTRFQAGEAEAIEHVVRCALGRYAGRGTLHSRTCGA
jgi:hypothetical protein